MSDTCTRRGHMVCRNLRHVWKGLAGHPRLLTKVSVPGLPLELAWRGLQRQHQSKSKAHPARERCPQEALARREGGGRGPACVALEPAQRRCQAKLLLAGSRFKKSIGGCLPGESAGNVVRRLSRTACQPPASIFTASRFFELLEDSLQGPLTRGCRPLAQQKGCYMPGLPVHGCHLLWTQQCCLRHIQGYIQGCAGPVIRVALTAEVKPG